MCDSVLERYALAYIKKSGGNSDVKEFLRYFNNTRNLTWDEDTFAEAYKEHTRLNSTNRRNTESRNNQYNAGNNRQPTGPQVTHIHVHNDRGLDFWDYLLLQCCIDSLFGGRGHTTNVTNINYDNNESREDKKKDSEDSRKLLALGMVAAVVCVAFHAGMCFLYNSSRKAARKEEKIDYLDNKLKMLRNIEFAVGAVSLAALVACAVYPVLPVWGLVILGVNSLVCFAGGLAFHMKHEKESDNIEKAEEAVRNYGSPPPYSPPSAPPYSEFNNSNVGGVFNNCKAC
ncbi:hypothetical protein [Wolbachia endosymbiont of Psylliodes chrysocephala]|uniref:hypothetical protein n=1 Tax=Wolbachia endosymbiont of Psylliodes chrysocephala TaxID=2883236 RepID=UPI0020A00B84|nr:hypothetical protein [Wolbachia endosymbiont of Psylliodes chrysocephala]